MSSNGRLNGRRTSSQRFPAPEVGSGGGSHRRPTRDRLGNTLILAGAVLGLAAASWSRYRGHPLWVTLLVAVPAMVIAGTNLVAGDSLLPHIAALATVPLGVAGITGGVVVGTHCIRS